MKPNEKDKALSLRKKGILILLLIMASLLTVEGLFRCWLLLTGGSQRPATVRQEILEIISVITDNIPNPEKDMEEREDSAGDSAKVPHPFVGYEPISRIGTVESLLDYFNSPESRKVYDVLVVGGSVAGRFGDHCKQIFADTLRADARFRNKEIRIINHARSGHKQPQQVSNVAFLLCAGYQPDAIINIDGFNEVALGFMNSKQGVFPLYPGHNNWLSFFKTSWGDPKVLDSMLNMRLAQHKALALAGAAHDYGLSYSSILSQYILSRLRALQREYMENYTSYLDWLNLDTRSPIENALRGPTFNPRNDFVISSLIWSWVEGSRSIDAMCDSRNIHYLHVLQPTLHYEGSKPVTDEERRTGDMDVFWKHGVRLGYPLLRKTGSKLAGEGIHFYDGTMLFKDVHETIYFDTCHFKGVGLEIFGKAVGEAFLKSLPSP